MGTLNIAHVRLACDGNLVEVLGAADDERMLDHVVLRERACEHGAELGRGNAVDDPARPGGVGERAEEVDEPSVRERPADGREGRKEWVVVGREEEVEVRVLRRWVVCVS